ncbi:hypothetical protein NHX12_005251 [Muraenolepis orangiensis]|uniref:39S ribosomal protein L46, mitochondrial n=1 Tax=Muraenolepis orangiensis TaxID=630683 RepID=A0A9Q0DR70_9TELE|nr:hypothetical protein NHX12_005251 [Muraenolepis orangiensis]
MSAPRVRMVGRCLHQLFKLSLSSAGRAGVGTTGVRRLSGAAAPHAAGPWRLLGAACVQRLAVISEEPRLLEIRFSELMHQMELERSLISDHELRLIEDKERMRRRQAADYDSDEEEVEDQDIVLTQDLEDAWEQKLKRFQTQARVQGDVDVRVERADRWLAEPLILLSQQEVGGEKLWLLPQTPWEAGETLKTTAQRALSSTPGLEVQTAFLGSAPCGLYKYRLPRAVQDSEGVRGVKVFFFKAVLRGPLPLPGPSSLWVRKSELKDYLKPSYLAKVTPFILHL